MTIRDGKKHIYYSFTPKTLKCEMTFINKKVEGVYQSYYHNGKPKVTAHFKNGKLHGEFIQLKANGRPEIGTFFENGKLNGPYARYAYDSFSHRTISNFFQGSDAIKHTVTRRVLTHTDITVFHHGKIADFWDVLDRYATPIYKLTLKKGKIIPEESAYLGIAHFDTAQLTKEKIASLQNRIDKACYAEINTCLNNVKKAKTLRPINEITEK